MGGPNAQLIDLCFVLDATGSMYPYIKEAEEKINSIAAEIRKTAKPKLEDPKDLRVAVLAYRDFPLSDNGFVTSATSDFTTNANNIKLRLSKLQAFGGGDGPEAVGTALDEALKLSWRSGIRVHKIIILITDAPPHGIGEAKDSGTDPISVLTMRHTLAEQKINLFVVKCLPTMQTEYKQAILFYDKIMVFGKPSSKKKQIQNGATVSLTDAGLLAKAVVGLALENNDLKKVVNDLDNAAQKNVGKKKIVLPPLHNHLLLIANNVDSVTQKHSSTADGAVQQVKKLLAGTEFASIKTNVFPPPLTSEQIHNIKIWEKARGASDVHGLRTLQSGAVNTSQTLNYEFGPINDDQVIRLASMYSAVRDDAGGDDGDGDQDDGNEEDGDEEEDEEEGDEEEEGDDDADEVEESEDEEDEDIEEPILPTSGRIPDSYWEQKAAYDAKMARS